MQSLKLKYSYIFLTRMFSFILNIVSTKRKQIDFDTFYLQEIKRVGQSFYIFGSFYSLILPDNIIIHYT